MPPVIERPSPNHGARRGGPIDMLVLHYTGMDSAEAALARLTDPASQVSAHYVIDEDGTVARLVAEERRAWHAGASFWAGERDINSRSIGIELVNPGHELGYRDFPEPQMAALIALARDILARHPIPRHRVLGHSDVAPTRKTDPGERFDWPRLAAAGIGLWPRPGSARPAPDADEARRLLARFGYDPEADFGCVLAAFQRHFRPARIDGALDAKTFAILRALVTP